jgi:hypothetical protein
MKNLLVLPKFLKNKYFVKGKLPKNDNVLLSINLFLKKTSFSKENVLVLPEFLKNKNFVKGKFSSFT